MTGDTGQPGFGGSGNCRALALATATGAVAKALLPLDRQGCRGKIGQCSGIATSRKQECLLWVQRSLEVTKQHARGEARVGPVTASILVSVGCPSPRTMCTLQPLAHVHKSKDA